MCSSDLLGGVPASASVSWGTEPSQITQLESQSNPSVHPPLDRPSWFFYESQAVAPAGNLTLSIDFNNIRTNTLLFNSKDDTQPIVRIAPTATKQADVGLSLLRQIIQSA